MSAKGLLIVNTGDGKGKTTAALGQVLRALGYGWRVCVIQFIKGSWHYGELDSVKRFSDLLDFHVLGKGFTWESANLQDDIRLAGEAWAFAADVIRSDRYRLVVLDELTYLIKYGMVAESDILGVLAARPRGVHVVVTGRDASAALINQADLVTEMRNIKHPFDEGEGGRQGIEY